MTSSTHFSMFFLILLTLSFINPIIGASKYALPFTKWRVVIVNNMSQGLLIVHCKSGDDDLDVHDVKVGNQYFWDFRENFWQSTRYWCSFESTLFGYHATFDVFWPEKSNWLGYRCDYRNCVWFARDSGFYLLNIPENKFELVHPWITPPN